MIFTELVGIRSPLPVSHASGSSDPISEGRGKKRERKNPQLLLSLLGSVKGVRDELERSRIEDESNHSERDVLEGQKESMA